MTGRRKPPRSNRGRRKRREAADAPAEALDARVIRALAESSHGPLKTKELARQLAIEPSAYRSFRTLLGDMEKRGTIIRVRGQRYAVATKLDLVIGSLSVTRDGHGFVLAA